MSIIRCSFVRIFKCLIVFLSDAKKNFALLIAFCSFRAQRDKSNNTFPDCFPAVLRLFLIVCFALPIGDFISQASFVLKTKISGVLLNARRMKIMSLLK